MNCYQYNFDSLILQFIKRDFQTRNFKSVCSMINNVLKTYSVVSFGDEHYNFEDFEKKNIYFLSNAFP